MYKLIYKIIFLFTSVILLSSCEDVIQIKLDKGGKLVVIDAFVDDLRKPQVVRVLNNTDYFSDQSSEPISNAQVVLKDLTAINHIHLHMQEMAIINLILPLLIQLQNQITNTN